MKAIIKSFVLLLFIICIAVSFSKCKKDTECIAIVTVKMQSDTTVIVSGAYVSLNKEDVTSDGYTDASGQFRNTFKLEAILDVDAMFISTSDTLIGKTVIRLKPGETVYKTVFIN